MESLHIIKALKKDNPLPQPLSKKYAEQLSPEENSLIILDIC
jgi:hypothetical protein